MIEPLYGQTMWNAMAAPVPAWSSAVSPVQVAGAGSPVAGTSQVRLAPAALSFPMFGAPDLIAPTSALVASVATRRGQPNGPATDAEIEDFLNDALDLIAGTADVEVRCEGGRAILTGSVTHKRHKRDIGEVAWAIPAVSDVQNNLTIVTRRRGRGAASGREADASAGQPRKHA